MQSGPPGSRSDTSWYTSSDTKCTTGEGGPPGTHVVHGDRSFDHHDADFVLFGVTAEETRRVGDVPRGSRYHLRRPQTARRGRALLVPRVRPPPLLPFR